MSVINTQIKPFKATAFRNGTFVDVTNEDVAGKWAIFFFYPGQPHPRHLRPQWDVVAPTLD